MRHVEKSSRPWARTWRAASGRKNLEKAGPDRSKSAGPSAPFYRALCPRRSRFRMKTRKNFIKIPGGSQPWNRTMRPGPLLHKTPVKNRACSDQISGYFSPILTSFLHKSTSIVGEYRCALWRNLGRLWVRTWRAASRPAPREVATFSPRVDFARATIILLSFLDSHTLMTLFMWPIL